MTEEHYQRPKITNEREFKSCHDKAIVEYQTIVTELMGIPATPDNAAKRTELRIKLEEAGRKVLKCIDILFKD